MTKDFSILKEDYNNSSKEFFSSKCPYAMAFKRQFPELYESLGVKIGVGFSRIFDSNNTEEDIPIARMVDGFWYPNYCQLRDEGVEFHTQIEIFEKEEE